MGGLHVLSLVLDILLAVLFRKVAQMPPDMNPLEDNLTSRAISKHKHKNSEMTASTMSVNEKHMSNMSGSTLYLNNQSQVSLPRGFSVPNADRIVPFAQSRVNLDASFSPHTLESARTSRGDLSERFYAQAGSQHGSRADLLSSSGSRPASRSRPSSRSRSRSRPRSAYVTETHEPMPEMPERVTSPGSFVSARSNAHSRMSPSPAPQAAITGDMAKRQQRDGLLNDNWYVEGDGSEMGTPVRGRSPRPNSVHEYMHKPGSRASMPKPLPVNAPSVPPKNENRFKHTYITEREIDQNVDHEAEENIGRALTMGSSIHSDGTSLKRSDSAKAKYYGDLPGMNIMQPAFGNGRVVSRTGVDIGDDSLMYFEEYGRRHVSGKMAEEGRVGREFRRREFSGTA